MDEKEGDEGEEQKMMNWVKMKKLSRSYGVKIGELVLKSLKELNLDTSTLAYLPIYFPQRFLKEMGRWSKFWNKL